MYDWGRILIFIIEQSPNCMGYHIAIKSSLRTQGSEYIYIDLNLCAFQSRPPTIVVITIMERLTRRRKLLALADRITVRRRRKRANHMTITTTVALFYASSVACEHVPYIVALSLSPCVLPSLCPQQLRMMWAVRRIRHAPCLHYVESWFCWHRKRAMVRKVYAKAREGTSVGEKSMYDPRSQGDGMRALYCPAAFHVFNVEDIWCITKNHRCVLHLQRTAL